MKEKWENEVFKEYIDQAKKTGTTVLATNYLDEYCFGGAFVLDKEGDIVSYLEIQKEGILLTDL